MKLFYRTNGYDPCRVLGRRSRAGRFQGPPSGSILKEQARPNQPYPPEVLNLIPDFWDMGNRDEDLIALTHVCQAWRETFISRSSLWAYFNCKNADKSRVYLERSKYSPINLWLEKENVISPCDPFLQIIPHSVGRLKSLSVKWKSRRAQENTVYLSCYAPLLERLDVDGGSRSGTWGNLVLTTTLFDGDLSSLRMLHLPCVRTELPWRNMINLTSFALGYTSPGAPSIRQFLDFFENAPLRRIKFESATPASGGQDGQLVSLACLKRMDILWGRPSLLLDHLQYG